MVSVFTSANFIKELDPVTYKQYTFEKFKEGHTGKNLVVETPEDVFRKIDNIKPKFKKKIVIDLPSAYDVPESKHYLESRECIYSGTFYCSRELPTVCQYTETWAFEHPKVWRTSYRHPSC